MNHHTPNVVMYSNPTPDESWVRAGFERVRPCGAGIHTFRAYYALHVDAARADRWNREGFLGRRDWRPFTRWERSCERCGHRQQTADAPYRSECPPPHAFKSLEPLL